MKSTKQETRCKCGRGLVNTLINKLPFDLHLPSVGPGTKLEKQLARGDRRINPLDAACKEYDIAYAKSNDNRLEHAAWARVKSKDTSMGERAELG